MEKESRIYALHMNRLIPVTILCWLSALLALAGLFTFDPFAYENMLVLMEVWDPDVISSAGIVFALLGAMSVLWPGALAVCMTATIANRSGFSVLSKILDVLSKVIRVVRYVLIGLFVWRAILYIIVSTHDDMVVYLVMGMLLFEGLFGVAFYFFLQLLIKFFSNASDTLASLQHVHYSGKLEYSSAHVLVNRTLILLGILGIGIAAYVYLYPFVDWFCPAGLVLTAISNIILSIQLNVCQTRISYEAYRLAKQKQQLDQPER